MMMSVGWKDWCDGRVKGFFNVHPHEISAETTIESLELLLLEKAKISLDRGVFLQKGHLKLNGSALDRDAKVQSFLPFFTAPYPRFSITLRKEPNGGIVKVRVPDGQVLTLVLSSLEVSYIKQELRSRGQVPKSHQRLTHDGRELDKGSLHDYGLAGDTVTLVLEVKEPTNRQDKEIQIQVKTLIGKTLTLPRIHSMDSVSRIKDFIASQEGIPSDQQRLIYEGRHLEDWKLLEDYQIREGSIVMMVMRLRGGGGGFPFADVTSSSHITINWFSGSAPEWRRCDRGLNLEGLCRRKGCKAFGSMVISPQGYTAFNVVKQEVTCPICKDPIQPVTCGFYDCLWRFEGIKTGTTYHLSGTLTEALGERYHRVSSDLDNMVGWDDLVISAQQSAKEGFCVICQNSFYGRDETMLTECGHPFHCVCFEAWRDIRQKQQTTVCCPQCRGTVSSTSPSKCAQKVCPTEKQLPFQPQEEPAKGDLKRSTPLPEVPKKDKKTRLTTKA